eukprot:scaffold4187_cov57-Phaeocystis_antarctica.AAC.6
MDKHIDASRCACSTRSQTALPRRLVLEKGRPPPWSSCRHRATSVSLRHPSSRFRRSPVAHLHPRPPFLLLSPARQRHLVAKVYGLPV